jgi:oligopeptide/dipeptide ABC transporter ATP-binding protein
MTHQYTRAVSSLLSVDDVSIVYEIGKRRVRAVTDAFLDVRAGEGVGIVGESGSGKSTFVRSLMALLPSTNARVTSGRLRVGNIDLAMSDTANMRKLRGHVMAMVFQDPLSYLNPLMTVRAQVAEAVRLNDPSVGIAKRVVELLDLVRLPQRSLEAYPHELSGGMRQRVLLAIALGCRPKLLVADEPTTALDVTTQAEILALLKDIMRELQMSLVLISHDLGVVASLCDRVYVMYGGWIVETGPRDQLLRNPAHPYTQALVHTARSVRTSEGRFVTLSGEVTTTGDELGGCPFVTRCKFAQSNCTSSVPTLFPAAGNADHLARCVLYATSDAVTP